MSWHHVLAGTKLGSAHQPHVPQLKGCEVPTLLGTGWAAGASWWHPTATSRPVPVPGLVITTNNGFLSEVFFPAIDYCYQPKLTAVVQAEFNSIWGHFSCVNAKLLLWRWHKACSLPGLWVHPWEMLLRLRCVHRAGIWHCCRWHCKEMPAPVTPGAPCPTHQMFASWPLQIQTERPRAFCNCPYFLCL